MTVLRASNAPMGLDTGKPTSTSAGPNPWTAPSDWITFTNPLPTEEKVIGTVGIFDNDSNFMAVNITTTDGSQYTVDWGDGTSTNHNSGTTAEKKYNWSDISPSTLTSIGYRQAIVTITPTIAGRTFSALSLSRAHSGYTISTIISSLWLNIAISAPNATGIDFALTTSGLTTSRVPALMLENVNIISSSVANCSYMFSDLTFLQNVNFKTSNPRITPVYMFQNCRSLRIAPALPAINGNAERMFLNCTSLQYVPLYWTNDPASPVSNMNSMFYGCRSLTAIPAFDTSAVTNFSSMFFNCTSLRTIPKLNMSSAQNTFEMFASCTSFESFPATNTGGFLSNTSGMFRGCESLISVGLFNISGASANISQMFQDCYSLDSVPFFNTATATTANSFLQNARSIQTVPSFNFSSVTNVSAALAGCRSLRTIGDLNLVSVSSSGNNSLGLGSASLGFNSANVGSVTLTNNKWSQTFQNCLLSATNLDAMYTSLATLNPAITNISGTGSTVTVTVGAANIRPFVTGRSVTISGVNPVAYNISGTVGTVNNTLGTFTINNAATGAYVSGGIASITSDRTITVTGNPGTATDNPTIATNKGWTVTG